MHRRENEKKKSQTKEWVPIFLNDGGKQATQKDVQTQWEGTGKNQRKGILVLIYE